MTDKFKPKGSFNPGDFESKWPRKTSEEVLRGKQSFDPGSFERRWSRKTSEEVLRGKQSFNPNLFEKKWQDIWEEKGVYQPDLRKSKRPFYNLMMFPYPSAEGLHVGNVYAFTGADIYGRYQRMKGNSVFEPIGLDGFGIHSENYAIKIGKHPTEQSKVSEKNFYRQLHSIGNGFAWKNKVETYDPDYYRWTQWIFVQMFKHGLAYRKKSPVNFCPSCKTVLSDEQVINGTCERCKNTVELKYLEQWFFKITDYVERLLNNLPKIDWAKKVKIAQHNWIGKKTGISIKYQVLGIKYEMKCFTTRPDTNFGATFIVIAPEHPFVDEILGAKTPRMVAPIKSGTPPRWRNLQEEIQKYVEKTKNKSEAERIAEGREKTGAFTGFYAINQLTGYKMPIYISDFVLREFGTGAVVGVPGHDIRDFEFAQKFNIPIIRVVVGKDGDKSSITKREQVQEEEGMMINSGFLDGMEIHDAIEKMMDYTEEKGWGKRVTTYHLRDWLISRQRYWGPPIPMIYCEKCGWQPIPEDDLPVLLPLVNDWKPEGTGKGPLAKIDSFVNVACPECGGAARRETDVSDTFLDSSWYFLRYPSVNKEQRTKNKEQEGDKNTSGVAGWNGVKAMTPPMVKESVLPWDQSITKKWLPVNIYIGGAEHSVLHLLYSRFVTMAFHDWGLLDFDEPFTRFYAHGLIIAEGAKMSKSKGNVVVPDQYISKYGADTLRTYLMFLGPFDMGGDFRDTGIAGTYRFLGRVWRLVTDSLKDTSDGVRMHSSEVEEARLTRVMHRTIKEVTEDMENLRYNTAIAHIMEYVNYLTESVKDTSDGVRMHSSEVKEAVKTLLLLLAPFAPHMSEELWQRISAKDTSEVIQSERSESKGSSDGGGTGKEFRSVHVHSWPVYNPKYLVEDEVTIVVQINGKTRGTVRIIRETARDKDTSEVAPIKSGTPLRWRNQKIVEEEAQKSDKIKKYLKGKTIIKVIFVSGRLINFVVK